MSPSLERDGAKKFRKRPVTMNLMAFKKCPVHTGHRHERYPFHRRHRLFYYLVSAFTMFLLDHPGHPMGMPFPGGFKVEEHNVTFFCLIRDHEKEVTCSICNFCPAHQTAGM